MINRFVLILLFCIVIVGFFLRIYRLTDVPFGFFCDEASIGYNSYSILTTGKDEYGQPFPLYFQSFGDYKAPFAIYSTAPLIRIFGLSEFAVRLNSVLYGMLLLIILYLLTRELFEKKLALLATLIAATMPWLIHYNRVGFELNCYVALFTATIYFLLKGVKNKYFIIPSFIVAALALYSYQSSKLLIPLLIVGMLIIYRKTFLSHKKHTVWGLSFFFLLCFPFVISLFNGTGLARLAMISVFSTQLSTSEIIFKMLSNYITQLSPNYFFFGEKTLITRHFTGGMMLPLLITTIPFFYIGIFTILKSLHKKSSQLLFYWLLLYPLAGAVVADPPFTGRAIIGAPLAAILIALGASYVSHNVKKHFYKNLATSIVGLLFLINFIHFMSFYFYSYPIYSSDFWGWQYGPKKIVNYFVKHEQIYDDLYMIDEFNAPEIFFKFYAPGKCAKCKIGTPLDSYNKNRRQLFAVTPAFLKANQSITFIPLETIMYADGETAFIIGEASYN